MTIRRFRDSDAETVSALIVRTLLVSNTNDYPAEMMEALAKTQTPKHVRQRASWTHFYVAEEAGSILGCGAIGPYWDREDESSLFTIFVSPAHQGRGIGRAIVETLEKDEFALRARRIEIPASATGLPFYQKMGYTFKNGVNSPDGEHLYRLEKHRIPDRTQNVLDLILSRRSYRGRYRPDKVPQEHLRAILEAGLAAPSGCNKQTASLIAVDDPALLEHIRAVIDPPVAESAPAMICVLTRRITAYRDRCFENMLLAIVALGYQSCWYEGHITDTDKIGDKIARLLHVPDEYELVSILPVGIAEEEPKEPPKKPFGERAWLNGFPGTPGKEG